MKNRRNWIAASAAAAVLLAAVLMAAEKKPGGLPPLKVGKDAPPLLDESAKPKVAAKQHSGPVADNQSCLVCHTNYQGETMAVSHAQGNVGCVACHGQSLAHCNDEDNVTPPDIIYPANKINAGLREMPRGPRRGRPPKWSNDGRIAPETASTRNWSSAPIATASTA